MRHVLYCISVSYRIAISFSLSYCIHCLPKELYHANTKYVQNNSNINCCWNNVTGTNQCNQGVELITNLLSFNLVLNYKSQCSSSHLVQFSKRKPPSDRSYSHMSLTVCYYSTTHSARWAVLQYSNAISNIWSDTTINHHSHTWPHSFAFDMTMSPKITTSHTFYMTQTYAKKLIDKLGNQPKLRHNNNSNSIYEFTVCCFIVNIKLIDCTKAVK